MNNLVIDAGKLIKFKRKVKGYSTQELAKILDVSPGLINNIENSKTDTFNIELLYKMSSALDTAPTEIISYNVDTVLNSILDKNNISPYLKLNINTLLKSLIQLSNNENLSLDKINMILEKLLDDIKFYNKMSSL